MNSPGRGFKITGLAVHFLAWLLICLILLGVSIAVPDALYFGGTPPIPLRANPKLLMIGVLLAPVCFLVLYFAVRSVGKERVVLGIAGMCSAILSLCIVVVSLFPGSGSIVGRDLVQQPEVAVNPSVFAFTVFFSNGGSALSASEIERLENSFAVFRSCESGTLWVRGFASSSKFIRNNEAMNLMLANKRAVAVKDVLERITSEAVSVFEWGAFEDMMSARRLRDTTLDDKPIEKMEGYNRRVEVFWNDSVCLGFGFSPALAPPVSGTSVTPLQD
ncbi:hypothetical protein ACNFH5_10265 [Pseudomonas sp. NY15435]|uniref:hypothetical protein n=1 Tax=Pseudomonas sp. NY15435 TaxID=3400358 RepID=UPI003A84DAFA